MKMKSGAHWLSIIINNESLLALLAWPWLQEGCGAWSWNGTARLHLWGSERWFPRALGMGAAEMRTQLRLLQSLAHTFTLNLKQCDVATKIIGSKIS